LDIFATPINWGKGGKILGKRRISKMGLDTAFIGIPNSVTA